MFYNFEWSNGKGHDTIKFDPEKIEARIRSRHDIYVRPRTQERLVELVDCLEANGFTPDKDWRWTRDEIIDRAFPISIDFGTKTYCSLGNVTNSVCACGCGIVAPEGLFYELCQSELDYVPESARVLADTWRTEEQEGVNPANYTRLYRIENVPPKPDEGPASLQ